MVAAASPLERFRQALLACHQLYRDGGDHPELPVTAPAATALDRRLEELYQGLVVKIYISCALVDGRWQSAERVLAAALVEQLWGRQLHGDDLKQVIIQLCGKAQELTWYSVLRPFVELPSLQRRTGELEVLALRVGQIVAEVDGSLDTTEVNLLRSIQNEIELHLRPLPIDEPVTVRRSHPVAEPLSLPDKNRSSVGATTAAEPPDLPTVLLQLDRLTGLVEIKQELKTLTNVIRLQQQRKQTGLPVTRLSLHMVFSGNPGTGKTTVARLVGQMLQALGILEKGHLIETDRSGLVAEYAGQTAIKTQRLIDAALGGVLFIDEAYSLQHREGDSYGREAVQALLKRMEDDRERLVVILAGYAGPMQELLTSNPGLSSRFHRQLHFPDYTPLEMLQIFENFGRQHHFEITPPAKARLLSGLIGLHAGRDDHFANGRLVRNVFEDAIRHLANRIAGLPDLSREQLCRFDVGDIQFAGFDEAEVQRNWEALSFHGVCDRCDRPWRISARMLGRRLKCRHCGTTRRIDWAAVAWPD